MTLMQSLLRLMSGATAGPNSRRVAANFHPVRPLELDPLSAITQYRVLRALYDENGMYEDLEWIMQARGLWKEALQPLRNPANRVVEFYAGNLWPGSDLETALPIEGCDTKVAEAILQTWKWSNWATKKQVVARWGPIYGDVFWKVIGASDPPRVFFQILEAETVSALFHDERGYITHIRIDVPIYRLQNFQKVPITLTEIWDKETDSMTTWEHEQGQGVDVSQLGDPLERLSISETYGIDFIPIVQGKWRDTGDARGQGAYAHCFDKITECNRMATRLHQLLFRHNNVTYALSSNGVDANKRPLPAPKVEGASEKQAPDDVLILGDDRFLTLPGNQTLEALVPQLPYGDALAILNAQMDEINQDLPELAYYRIKELGGMGLSGRAIRLLMNDAIDRALESRGNMEAALVRANMMALTIGTNIGAFRGIGTYESGSLDHFFKQRPMIRTSDLEDAQESLTEAQAGVLWEQLGVSRQEILRQAGYDDDEIKRMMAENVVNQSLLPSIVGTNNGQTRGQAAAAGEVGTAMGGESGMGPRNTPLEGGSPGGGRTITGQQP